VIRSETLVVSWFILFLQLEVGELWFTLGGSNQII
jgi:hypothetical protein